MNTCKIKLIYLINKLEDRSEKIIVSLWVMVD